MEYYKGKGAQINVANRFQNQRIDVTDTDGLDEELLESAPNTQVFIESPKKVVSYNESPDVPFNASINPYQGCEHGCVYCYARNSHEYWGFSAGLDFESKIVVKPNVHEVLSNTFLKPNYKAQPIMLSGNTDCYQPLEKQYQLTRKILEVCLRFRHPVGIITKNALVSRDVDLLEEMARHQLVSVLFSINTLNESLRRVLEPRTASGVKKLKSMELLAAHHVPVGVMNAPVIPSLNHHEIPEILKSAASAGASFASYTVVRFNGQIGQIFRNWLEKNFPDRAEKVWNQVSELHGGSVNDSEYGRRNRGEGNYAEMIRQLFKVNLKKYYGENQFPTLSVAGFRKGGHYQLF